jgi:hypothetical protein
MILKLWNSFEDIFFVASLLVSRRSGAFPQDFDCPKSLMRPHTVNNLEAHSRSFDRSTSNSRHPLTVEIYV